MLKVYTDGGCFPNNGNGFGSWCFCLTIDDQIVSTHSGFENGTTNNRMEYMAVIKALETLPNNSEAVIHSDSQLLVNTYNLWMHSWEKRGWCKKGGEIKNIDLVTQLFSLKKKKPRVKLAWVKGHSNNRFNNHCDAVCSALISNRKHLKVDAEMSM